MGTLRTILVLVSAFGFVATASAQNFRVQVAAYADSVAPAYFKARGIEGVIASVDAAGIYRYYYGSYATRAEAEKVQKQLIVKGFTFAAIIDLEEQRVLSNVGACPYFKGGPVYAPSTNENVRVLYFDLGKDILTADAKAELDRVFKLMSSKPALQLRILGYTDAVGSGKANIELATNRARAARNYLLDKGLNTERMLLRVFGESEAGKVEEEIERQNELDEARKRFRCVLLALVEP